MIGINLTLVELIRTCGRPRANKLQPMTFVLWDLEMGSLSAPAEQAAVATPEPALTTMSHNCPSHPPSVAGPALGESQSTDNQTSSLTSPPSQPSRGPETVSSAEPPSDATISDPTRSHRVGRLPKGAYDRFGDDDSGSKHFFPVRVISMPRAVIL